MTTINRKRTKTASLGNTEGKHRRETQKGNTEGKHRRETQKGNNGTKYHDEQPKLGEDHCVGNDIKQIALNFEGRGNAARYYQKKDICKRMETILSLNLLMLLMTMAFADVLFS